MSVRFEKKTEEAVKAAQNVMSGAEGGAIPGTSGKHPIAAAVGTALTGGKEMAGTKGYLMAYIKQIEENPLRTKMLTAGTLAGTQELIASFLAKDRNKHGNYFTSRVPKMAAYGALVSAPLGHFLIWLLQLTFRGRTSLKAKIMQIVVSNLIVSSPLAHHSQTLLTVEDRPYPEQRLPCRHGAHRRRAHLPPGPRHRQGRLLEGHARVLDHLAHLPGLCAAVPA